MLKSIVQRTPLYPVARRAYRAIFKADERLAIARMDAFYAQFFQPGDVVFDVGANQGEYAESFAREGATVVAIEPNPDFRLRLSALARGAAINPEFVAVSDAPGEATLNVCSTSGYSTLASPDSEWITGSPDYEGVSWVGQVTVPVVTLDQLAERHGTPSFVKIDIEGHELAALRGMSFRPAALSFEYGVRRKDLAQACIAHLQPKGYRFRPIPGRDFRFETPLWMTGEETLAWLEARTLDKGEYGDLFALRLD